MRAGCVASFVPRALGTLGLVFVFCGHAAASPNASYLDDIDAKVRADLGAPDGSARCEQSAATKKLQCIAARQNHRTEWLAAFSQMVFDDFHIANNKHVSKYLKTENGDPVLAINAVTVMAPHLAPVYESAESDWAMANSLLAQMAQGSKKDGVHVEVLTSFNLAHPDMTAQLEAVARNQHNQLISKCHPFIVDDEFDLSDAKIKAAPKAVFPRWISCIDTATAKANEGGQKIIASFKSRGFDSAKEKAVIYNFVSLAGGLGREAREQAIGAQKKNVELNKKSGCDAECVRKAKAASVRLGLVEAPKFNQAQYDKLVSCANRNVALHDRIDHINDLQRTNRQLERRFEDMRQGSRRRALTRDFNDNVRGNNDLVADYNRDNNAHKRSCGEVSYNKPTAKAACRVIVVSREFPKVCQ